MDEKRRSPRTRILLGCGGCALLLFLVAAVTAWSGYRFAKDSFKTSPEDRDAAALELLGTDRLPDGYYAIGALSVPMVLRLAILSDRPPSPGGAIETGDRTFFYARASSILSISGEDEDSLFEIAGLELSGNQAQDQPERNGVLDITGGQLRYTRYSGGAIFQGQPLDGLVTAMAIRCSRTDAFQAALWILPNEPTSIADEPHPDQDQAAAVDYTQTDSDAILGFINQFTLCDATQ